MQPNISGTSVSELAASGSIETRADSGGLPVRARLRVFNALVAASLMLLLAMIAIFVALAERRRAASEPLRGQGVWAIYELDREGGTALIQFRPSPEGETAPLRAIHARLSALRGQMAEMAGSDGAPFYADDPAAARAIADASRELDGLIVDASALLAAPDPRAGLADFNRRLLANRDLSHAMLLAVREADMRQRQAEREQSDWLFLLLAMSVVGLTLSKFAIMAVISRQAKRVARSQAELAQSERENLRKSLALRQRDERETLLRREAEIQTTVHDFNDRLNGYVSRLATMIEEVTQQSELMRSSADLARDGSGQAARSSSRAADHVAGVAGSAEQMSAASQDITRKGEVTAVALRDARTQADLTSAAIEELAKATAQISSITGLIKDVAETTNLLALNATIEAARAGTAGRGFAVVASEIKSLANQTKRATSAIGRQITAIQSAADFCVEAMADIQSRMAEMTAVSEQVVSIVGQQSLSAADLARMIRAAAEDTAAASSTVRGVWSAVDTASANAQAVAELARLMNEESRMIKADIARLESHPGLAAKA